MLSRTLTVAAIALMLALGISGLARGDVRSALWLLGAVLVWWLRRRTGEVWSAFNALRRGDLARAQHHLRKTRYEELGPGARARYHWVEAALAEARGDVDEAATKLTGALAFDALAGDDRALCLVTLAAIERRQGATAEATRRLDEAADLASSTRLKQMIARARR